MSVLAFTLYVRIPLKLFRLRSANETLHISVYAGHEQKANPNTGFESNCSSQNSHGLAAECSLNAPLLTRGPSLDAVIKLYKTLKSAGHKPEAHISAPAAMASVCESRAPAAITGSTNSTLGWKRKNLPGPR
jgi:hypothetical protein